MRYTDPKRVTMTTEQIHPVVAAALARVAQREAELKAEKEKAAERDRLIALERFETMRAQLPADFRPFAFASRWRFQIGLALPDCAPFSCIAPDIVSGVGSWYPLHNDGTQDTLDGMAQSTLDAMVARAHDVAKIIAGVRAVYAEKSANHR